MTGDDVYFWSDQIEIILILRNNEFFSLFKIWEIVLNENWY